MTIERLDIRMLTKVQDWKLEETRYTFRVGDRDFILIDSGGDLELMGTDGLPLEMTSEQRQSLLKKIYPHYMENLYV